MNISIIECPTLRPYVYQVANTKGRLTNYSDPFATKFHARKWYKNFGANLEKMFERKLVFTKRVYRYSDELKRIKQTI